MIPRQAVARACSVAVDVAYSLPSRSWIRPARIWRCTAMPTWFGRSLGHAAYSSRRVLPVARARTRSLRPRLRALGSPPADLLVAALGGRPRLRVALEAFASAAEADLGLLAGGVLLTRVSTRSAVSSDHLSGNLCAVGIEACKPLADLRLLCVDLVQY